MRKIWTSRPPASCRSARAAWDYLSCDEKGRHIVKMWRGLELWAWVAKMSDGDYADVDALVAMQRGREAAGMTRGQS